MVETLCCCLSTPGWDVIFDLRIVHSGTENVLLFRRHGHTHTAVMRLFWWDGDGDLVCNDPLGLGLFPDVCSFHLGSWRPMVAYVFILEPSLVFSCCYLVFTRRKRVDSPCWAVEMAAELLFFNLRPCVWTRKRNVSFSIRGRKIKHFHSLVLFSFQ
jgi:hypothetical protein